MASRLWTTEQDLEKNKADILHLTNDKALGQVELVEEPWLAAPAIRLLSVYLVG